MCFSMLFLCCGAFQSLYCCHVYCTITDESPGFFFIDFDYLNVTVSAE